MRRNDDLVGVGIQPLDALITMQNLAPLADWSQLSESDHFVHFYETDRFLIDLLSHFIGTGLSAGDACLVVATKAHREDLDERLTASGVDVAAAKACGQFLSLDAAETLSKFLVDGSPEPERFKEVVGGLLAQAAVGRGVRAFGEMVALLWAQGNHSGAIRLEALWNELRRTQPFSLFCAYPVNSFAGETMTAQLSGVCGEHTCVIPAESYTALVDADDRLRAIALLQQKARLLETEIAERKAAEARLREQAEMIETINRAGQALSAELNLQNVVQVVTDASTELTGAQFGAFFYNVIDHSGESYMLYSLSGVPREAFAHFPMPRNTDLFGQTFRGDGIIRIADVKQDPRYGKNSPYYGMPRGHLPVTSYLAIPVISRAGQVLGGLFFGHPHENVFTERHERLIEGLAAQAAIAMDNAQLYELSQRERAKAEAANRAKDEFLATVSHELRTPLNAIIGWSHMLRRGRLDEATVSRAVETIERNAKSQAQLIEDILDVSRVITGKLRLKVGPVDIVSVISAAIDSVQLAADSKSIKLGVILDPSARHISGDASRLQQVVWNLLSNAIKFTPAGGQVEVRLERAGANAKIVVSDTGEGISEDFLPFIFDRFRQADGSLTRRQGGLGLGLAIVKHLIELHGGAVYADSAGAGRGATFTIELPHRIERRRAKSRKEETEGLIRNENYNVRRQPLPSLEGVMVLVVDDDRDTLEMVTAVLTEYGATVQGAASAAEAIDTLQWCRPDVLVSDLAMPDEDGYSLIRRVRDSEAESDHPIPAVALTALVRVDDRMRALSAGFNMFVPKPVEPDELIAAIANLAEPATTKYR